MTTAEILKNLQTLQLQFSHYHKNWIDLKNKTEFIHGVSHSSPIREMYAEGSGCALYLTQNLDTSQINKYIIIDEYIKRVCNSLTPEKIYHHTGEAAQQDFDKNYPDNYTIRHMLRLYWDQWETIKHIKKYLNALIASSTYQYSANSTPIHVIKQHAEQWEKNSQLHKGLNENALRSQLVLALKNAGFDASAETHMYQGHADIVVRNSFAQGTVSNEYLLVAECKFWKGQNALFDAFSQLCQYVTPHENHAALIVFVDEGSFSDICKKAAQCLIGHPSCVTPSTVSMGHIEYSLIPAQNQELRISAVLLLCNLTTPRYL